ncbi:hypothetical protein ARMGADRAFT_1033670 [Armillaria gallica]|uniref:Uncharacterized protein n=1 Tax=Armillaria gallica TaxID=47427 RepID=A0A2H3D5R5_ARMGA|nr:hypothetical protein ARMGADRAFT_1033670 [Armillaria gallica]
MSFCSIWPNYMVQVTNQEINDDGTGDDGVRQDRGQSFVNTDHDILMHPDCKVYLYSNDVTTIEDVNFCATMMDQHLASEELDKSMHKTEGCLGKNPFAVEARQGFTCYHDVSTFDDWRAWCDGYKQAPVLVVISLYYEFFSIQGILVLTWAAF